MAYVKRYFDIYTEKTIENKPDVLGHFDLVAKFSLIDEASAQYRSIVAGALDECLKITPFVEVNTGAVCRGIRSVPYPNTVVLEEILRRDGKIILNSDSHEIENMEYYFDESVQLLKLVGFKSIVQLRKSGFEEVGID